MFKITSIRWMNTPHVIDSFKLATVVDLTVPRNLKENTQKRSRKNFLVSLQFPVAMSLILYQAK